MKIQVPKELLAGTWMLRDGRLPDGSADALRRRLVETVAADPARYALPESGPCFGPSPLADSLEEHVGALRNAAHGTIYATAALRALAEQPELATSRSVGAIVELHRGAQLPDPDRYYGIEDHEAVEIEVAPPAEKLDSASLVLDSLREFDVVYDDETDDHQQKRRQEKQQQPGIGQAQQ